VELTKKFSFGWLIPLIFLAGQLIICIQSEVFDVRYILLTTALAVVSMYLIRHLGGFSIVSFPLWLLLIITFVTYFIQFYWILLDPQITANCWFPNLHWLAYSPEVRFNSFLTATLGFVAFGITAYIIAAKPIQSPKPTPNTNTNNLFAVSILTWLIVVLITITCYIMYATGICRMGAETVTLPFRMGGWILYSRTTLIPGLILLLIWCSDNAQLKQYFIFGIILLLIHGITEVLLTSSRGFFLILFLDLLFLLILSGRLTKHRLGFIIGAAILTITLWPLFSYYRYERMPDHKVPITASFREAVENLFTGPSTYSEESATGIQSIFFRTGMISLLPIMGSDPEPLGAGILETSPTNLYTNDVLGYSPDHITSSAPSLMGWLYLLGGNITVVIGVSLFTVIFWSGWQLLTKLKLLSLPVGQAMFLGFILGTTIEGTLDQLWLQLLIISGSIAACEFIFRFGNNKLADNNLRLVK
jgi:hypothetical protein